MLKERFLTYSPFVVILIGFLTSWISIELLSAWFWVPLTLIYWLLLGIIIRWYSGSKQRKVWLSHASGKNLWIVFTLIVGLIPLPILIFNNHLIQGPSIWILWILFALINPWFEEFYWRGLLLDHLSNWIPWKRVLFTSALFAANHPITWGLYSIGNREPVVFASTFVMGIIWGFTYEKTKSLRWVIFSHILVDLFNLSILTFMNIYVPK